MLGGTTIICFIIALVLTITKLLLEHQRDIDVANGCADEKDAYTIQGMRKRMKRERKAQKRARKEEKWEAKLAASRAKQNTGRSRDFLPVKSFGEEKK